MPHRPQFFQNTGLPLLHFRHFPGKLRQRHSQRYCIVVSPELARFDDEDDLVGGFKDVFFFPFHIWDVILPIDELHHFQDG